MQRRKFLTSAGAGLAASTVVVPTLTSAQTAVLPTIKWRMTSSFSKSLDAIGPCNVTSVKPIGKRILKGQRIKPPALVDTSLPNHESVNIGQDMYAITTQTGMRNTTVPIRSSHSFPRSESMV